MTHSPVVVLGASGALGSRIAQRLANDGYPVIGTASSQASLEHIPESVSQRITLDLSDLRSCDGFAARVTSDHPSLSGVVIASGVVGFAPASEPIPVDMTEKMLAVNYSGPARVVSGLFPALVQGQGFVLGITGVVVEQPFAGMAHYTASKAALSAYLQAITREWRRHKISVTEARLGHTETGLANHPLFGAPPQMPQGHDPDHVVAAMVGAATARTPLLASTDF